MRPRGTRKRYSQRLTKTEKGKILAATGKGIKQIQIAREFGCDVSTIRNVQKAAGLGRYAALTPALEAEVVALLRQGVGFQQVAKRTRLSSTTVKRIMAKYRIYHRVGDPGLGLAKHARILERVRQREDFGVHIAEKENVSSDTVLRMAHRIYGPHRFRNRGEPLTSPMNSDSSIESNYDKFLEKMFRKHFPAEAKEMQRKEFQDTVVKLVEQYFDLHNIDAVSDRAALLDEMLEFYVPKRLRSDFRLPLTQREFEQERAVLAGYIRIAMDHIIGPESHWTN
jgi:DNA-binding CsgD family transcriptional regulator